MKCLSIKQPWVELILRGKKTVEIRTWNTKFRGYFLIHASKGVDRGAISFYNFDLEDLTRGYIVGYADLTDVKVYRNRSMFLEDRENHLSLSTPNRYPVYGFVLGDVHQIDPVKYLGRLGFFNVPEDIVKLDKFGKYNNLDNYM